MASWPLNRYDGGLLVEVHQKPALGVVSCLYIYWDIVKNTPPGNISRYGGRILHKRLFSSFTVVYISDPNDDIYCEFIYQLNLKIKSKTSTCMAHSSLG